MCQLEGRKLFDGISCATLTEGLDTYHEIKFFEAVFRRLEEGYKKDSQFLSNRLRKEIDELIKLSEKRVVNALAKGGWFAAFFGNVELLIFVLRLVSKIHELENRLREKELQERLQVM